MLNVTWRRFDQSVKQLIVGHTTTATAMRPGHHYRGHLFTGAFHITYIPLLQLVQTIKILGVTYTSSLSVTLHVQSVIAASAQTLYALRVLCKHGLCDDSLHDIFYAVQSPSQNSCIHPTPGGDAPTPTTDRKSLRLLYSHWFLLSRSSRLPRPLHFFGWEIILENLNLPNAYPTDTFATIYCTKLQS